MIIEKSLLFQLFIIKIKNLVYFEQYLFSNDISDMIA